MKKVPTDFEREWLERQARGNAAWGAYAAYVRDQNFLHQLREYNEQIRTAGCEEDRRKAEEAKKEFAERCKSNDTIHIGPF